MAAHARSKAVWPKRIKPSHVRTKSRLLLQSKPTVTGDPSIPDACNSVDRILAARLDRVLSAPNVSKGRSDFTVRRDKIHHLHIEVTCHHDPAYRT